MEANPVIIQQAPAPGSGGFYLASPPARMRYGEGPARCPGPFVPQHRAGAPVRPAPPSGGRSARGDGDGAGSAAQPRLPGPAVPPVHHPPCRVGLRPRLLPIQGEDRSARLLYDSPVPGAAGEDQRRAVTDPALGTRARGTTTSICVESSSPARRRRSRPTDAAPSAARQSNTLTRRRPFYPSAGSWGGSCFTRPGSQPPVFHQPGAAERGRPAPA